MKLISIFNKILKESTDEFDFYDDGYGEHYTDDEKDYSDYSDLDDTEEDKISTDTEDQVINTIETGSAENSIYSKKTDMYTVLDYCCRNSIEVRIKYHGIYRDVIVGHIGITDFNNKLTLNAYEKNKQGSVGTPKGMFKNYLFSKIENCRVLYKYETNDKGKRKRVPIRYESSLLSKGFNNNTHKQMSQIFSQRKEN